jgi:anti-anti-sigma factor
MKVLDIVEREPEVGVREIAVVGELDETGRTQLETAIRRAHDARAHLLFDLEACEFVDSTGLGEIVRAHQAALSEGRSAIVHGLQPEVERLFSVSGLTEDGLVVRSREDALIALADRGLMHPRAGD